MSLPKLTLPKYEHTLVGLGKKIKFRPFTNQEQKVLLLAKTSKGSDTEKSDILGAIDQIITNCTFGELKAENLSTFDVEDLFLRIRSKSVSELVTMRYRYNYDDDGAEKTKFIDVEVNLDDVKVQVSEDHNNKIELDENVGLIMKYPTFGMLDNITTDEDLAISCIDVIYNKDELFSPSEYTKEELIEFYDSIDTHGLLKVKKFFDTMPKLRHSIDVDLGDGEIETVTFEGLEDFFM